MNPRRSQFVLLALLIAAFVLLFSHSSAAQQVTYYTFDNASGNYSYSCLDPAYSEDVNNPLLCFNNGTGASGASPALTTESCGASDTRCPYSDSSSHTAIQLTPATQSQKSSVWFSIPQKVTNGFTSYFAFRIKPGTPPSGYAPPTADGIAFVLQNAEGCTDDEEGCVESGSGPNVVGNDGGNIGYGGIDNSLASEFDTFDNSEFSDPSNDTNTPSNPGNLPYQVGPPANHIAVQSCGVGANSPTHKSPTSGGCLVGGTSGINNQLPITLADGHIHEAVIEYSGENGNPANLLQIYIDPTFVTGTHTPVATATPVISLTYDVGDTDSYGLDLLDTNCPYGDCPGPFDSAYVGFTAGTGGEYETQTILSWTFTPHTTVTQQQPINNGGQPTTFPFGNHTYAVTYPSGTASSTDMIVIANTISQPDFATLVTGTSFQGSVCQIYDGTGGNCIIYSVYCVDHSSGVKEPCPATEDQTIAVKTAYESDSTLVPASPGFLKGDPLYSPITSIQGNGATATVSCTGECSVTDGETVSIRSDTALDLNAEGVTVLPGSTVDTFSYNLPAPATDSGTGGFVTSGQQLVNICYPINGNPPCWQPQRIDATTLGGSKNFSDLVALFQTAAATMTSITTNTINYGDVAQIVVTVTPSTGPGPATGSVTLTIDNGTPLPAQTLTNGTTTFLVPGLTAGPHSLSVSYQPGPGFLASNGTGTQMVNQVTPTITWANPSAITYGTALGGMQLNAVASVPGMLQYMPAATTVLGAGLQTLKVTFTPMDGTDYSSTSTSVMIQVNKATPVITWVPASIQFGYPLTAAQLDATASGPLGNVGGGFVYTPPLNTVVNTPSSFPLSLSFTPSDTTDYNGTTANVPLTVTPGPIGTVVPTSIAFGTVYLGSITTKTVTVTNTGNLAMAITGPLISILKGGNSNEFISVNLCPKSLAAGKNCIMTVSFVAGPFYMPQTATLSVMDNGAPPTPQTVPITATVINPQATLSTGSINFGSQKSGTTSSLQKITLKNPGATTLTINSISVAGANPTDFTTPTTTCGATLNAGSSCTISIGFKPVSKGTWSGTLTVKDNALIGTQTVSLTGKGT